MDFWGSWRVRAKARTLSYVTEQGSVKTPKRRELRRKSRFWPNKLISIVCLSFACLLLLPKSTKVSFGVPCLCSQWHCASHGRKNKQKAPKNRCFYFILGSLKSQNFDVFKPHKYTVSCGGPVTFLGKFLRGRVRVAHFVFKITLSQAITLTLMLVCAFSPRVHSIPRGPHNWQFPQGHKKSRQKSGI